MQAGKHVSFCKQRENNITFQGNNADQLGLKEETKNQVGGILKSSSSIVNQAQAQGVLQKEIQKLEKGIREIEQGKYGKYFQASIQSLQGRKDALLSIPLLDLSEEELENQEKVLNTKIVATGSELFITCKKNGRGTSHFEVAEESFQELHKISDLDKQLRHCFYIKYVQKMQRLENGDSLYPLDSNGAVKRFFDYKESIKGAVKTWDNVTKMKNREKGSSDLRGELSKLRALRLILPVNHPRYQECQDRINLTKQTLEECRDIYFGKKQLLPKRPLVRLEPTLKEQWEEEGRGIKKCDSSGINVVLEGISNQLQEHRKLFLAKGQDLNEKVREQRESTLKGIFCEIKKLPNDNKSVLQEVLECEFQIACLSAQMGKDAYFDAKEVPFHNRTVREIRAYNSKENLTEEEKKRIKEYKEFRDSSRYEIEEVRRRRTENFKKLGEYGKKLTELRSKFEMDSSKQKEQLQNSIFQNQSQMNNSQSSVQKNVNSNIKSSQHSSQRSEYLQQIPDQLNSNVYHEMDSSKQKEQFNQQNSIFQHQPQNQMNNSQSSVQKNVDSNIKSSQHSSQRNEYLQQIPGQLNSNVYNVEVHSPKQKEQLQNSIFQNQSQMNNSQSLVKQKTQSLIQGNSRAYEDMRQVQSDIDFGKGNEKKRQKMLDALAEERIKEFARRDVVLGKINAGWKSFAKGECTQQDVQKIENEEEIKKKEWGNYEAKRLKEIYGGSSQVMNSYNRVNKTNEFVEKENFDPYDTNDMPIDDGSKASSLPVSNQKNFIQKSAQGGTNSQQLNVQNGCSENINNSLKKSIFFSRLKKQAEEATTTFQKENVLVPIKTGGDNFNRTKTGKSSGKKIFAKCLAENDYINRMENISQQNRR